MSRWSCLLLALGMLALSGSALAQESTVRRELGYRNFDGARQHVDEAYRALGRVADFSRREALRGEIDKASEQVDAAETDYCRAWVSESLRRVREAAEASASDPKKAEALRRNWDLARLAYRGDGYLWWLSPTCAKLYRDSLAARGADAADDGPMEIVGRLEADATGEPLLTVVAVRSASGEGIPE